MPRQRILVVEDEFDVCNVLQSFFGKRGYDVSVTASGAEALRLIPILKPDFVLLDIILEEMNGLEVLKQLRESNNNVKVVIMTGQILQDKTIQAAFDMGVVEYFQKPIILSRLETAVAKAMEGQHVHMEAPVLDLPEDAGPLSQRMHKIVDHLGVIRVQCENYVLDNPNDPAVGVLKSVMSKVDEIVGCFEL